MADQLKPDAELVTHNALGHVLDHPHCKVSRVFELHPADHIAFPRFLSPEADWFKLYWHHAIIEDIDYQSELIRVIHFQPIFDDGFKEQKERENNQLELFNAERRKGKILRNTITFSQEKIYKVQYKHEECLPEPETLLKALSKVDDMDYNIFENNCEHFAVWCKTGRMKSFQRKTFNKTITRSALGNCGKVATNQAAKRLLTSTPSMARTLGKAGGRATLFVGAAIEAGCMAYDIRKAKKAKKEGRLSDRDFEDVIGKRVAVAVGDVSLSTAGILGGAAVAGPVGAVVGGFIGSALGTMVGVAAGFVGADVRKTLSEHDIFKRDKTEKEEEEKAIEAEKKSDQQNRI